MILQNSLKLEVLANHAPLRDKKTNTDIGGKNSLCCVNPTCNKSITERFWENEDVLAFNGSIISFAKIRSIVQDKKTNANKYELHYEGWIEQYHKCVTKDYLIKLNEETASIKKKLDVLSAPCTRSKAKRLLKDYSNSPLKALNVDDKV